MMDVDIMTITESQSDSTPGSSITSSRDEMTTCQSFSVDTIPTEMESGQISLASSIGALESQTIRVNMVDYPNKPDTYDVGHFSIQTSPQLLKEWEVTKRDGRREKICYVKILQRLSNLIQMDPPLDETHIDIEQFIPKIAMHFIDGIETTEIDKLLKDEAYYMSTQDPIYEKLAVRLAVSDNHKNTKEYDNLSEYLDKIENFPIVIAKTSKTKSLMSNAALTFAKKHIDILQANIDFKRDYDFTYFGYETMMKSYAFKIPYLVTQSSTQDQYIKFKTFERPQHAYLRVALEINVPDPKRFLSHFIHFPTKRDSQMNQTWNENYDDWFKRNSEDQDDCTNPYFHSQDLPKHVKSVYGINLDNLEISNFMNPFTVSSKKLLLMVKEIQKRGGDIFKEMEKYQKVYTHEEEIQILNYALMTYDLLSLKIISVPTPVFQSNKKYISCFLMGKPGDSIPLIYESIKEAAMKAKGGGGIGFPWTKIRAMGSYIEGSNSVSNGLIPIQKIKDKSKEYVDQGGNKRAGPQTGYIECWHADFFRVLDTLRMEQGSDYRAEGVKGAIWFNELLAIRALKNQDWSFFCPRDVPNLLITTGEDFIKEYEAYEKAGLAKKVMKAHDVMIRIANTMLDSGAGACHIMNCDAVNFASVQQCRERGIKVLNGNICLEIELFSNEDESATCVLGTICLPKFYMTSHAEEQFLCNFDFHLDCEFKGGALNPKAAYDKSALHPRNWLHFMKLKFLKSKSNIQGEEKYLSLRAISRVASFFNHIQNAFIQQSSVPSRSSFIGLFNQRAVGLGYQGYQDLLIKMKIPYDSIESQKVIHQITESGLYGYYCNSIAMGEKYGITPYWKSVGMEYSIDAKGILPFDFYYQKFPHLYKKMEKWMVPHCNWPFIRASMIRNKGKYNGKGTSSPPTATSSNVAGYNEGFEPYTALHYKRRTNAGEYLAGATRKLIKILKKRNCWNEQVAENMVNGTFQQSNVPNDIKALFRSAWEIGPFKIMDVYFHAQVNIDHAVSMNLWIENYDTSLVLQFIYYAIKRNLKTIVYYLHKRFPAPKTLAGNILLKSNGSCKIDNDKFLIEDQDCGCDS